MNAYPSCGPAELTFPQVPVRGKKPALHLVAPADGPASGVAILGAGRGSLGPSALSMNHLLADYDPAAGDAVGMSVSDERRPPLVADTARVATTLVAKAGYAVNGFEKGAVVPLRRRRANFIAVMLMLFLVWVVPAEAGRSCSLPPMRDGVVLDALRGISETKKRLRERAYDSFGRFLQFEGRPSIEQLIELGPRKLSGALQDYGRALFTDGVPRYHYVQAILAVLDQARHLKGQLQGAWDMNIIWKTLEPSRNHLPYPSLYGRPRCPLPSSGIGRTSL